MGAKEKPDAGRKLVAQNRKARFEFEILDKIEAGIALRGSEVKSLRSGKASLDEAYALVDERDEVYLVNSHIPEYPNASLMNHEPKRKRKLLLHRAEIVRLRMKLKEKGLTLVPLALYFSKGRIKVELALGKGKRRFDKRQSIRQRDDRREMSRAISRRR